MSHGGKREGAGRPTGSRDKKYQKIVDRLSELNLCPLTGMVDMLEDPNVKPELRFKILEHLSNRLYPKIQPVTHLQFRSQNNIPSPMLDLYQD